MSDNNEAVLEAIDNGRPFSWLPRESMMNFVTSLVKIEHMLEGERLHDMYDGNGRLRSNGGFCG